MNDHTNAKADQAQANFDRGYNCAQSVLLAYAAESGLSDDQAKLAASVFGAGMVRLQATCGALTGAFMALGFAEGFTDPADQPARDRLLADARGLAAAFQAEFGAMDCRSLLGCDLNTPEGQDFHKAQNQRQGICRSCVRFTAAWLSDKMA